MLTKFPAKGQRLNMSKNKMHLSVASPKVFSALLAGNVKELNSFTQNELRPFLPCLCRMVLGSIPTSSVAESTMSHWDGKRKVIHALIAGMEEANAIKKYLEIDFQELKQDALREQQLLKKLGPSEERAQSQSVLASSVQFGVAIEFERSNHLRRFRLFLSEMLRILNNLDNSAPFKFVQSDLFECEVHMEEICDVMCIAVAELPSLLPVTQFSEALLRLEKGPQYLARVIANMPNCFDDVVSSLVLNGETLDEVSLAGRCRTAAIRMICHMHPAKAGYVQWLAVSNCKHPTLALLLALETDEKHPRPDASGHHPLGTEPLKAGKQAGVVTLLHNIIIAGDDHTRAWFAQYLKCMQQKYRRHKYSAVTKLRLFIMRKLHSFSKLKSRPPTSSLSAHTTNQESKAENRIAEESELVMDTGDSVPSSGETKTEDPEKEIETQMSTETLEELVDQMEIQISDHEDEGDTEDSMESTQEDESSHTEGKNDQPASKEETDKVKMSAVVRAATDVSSSGPVSGGSAVESGEVKPERRRRHSSIFEKIEFPPISLEKQLSDDDIIELMELLQVCCALKTQTQMYLKEEEAAAILSLIVCSCPPFSPAGVRFIEITLCVLLACPFLISIDGCQRAVERWFKWLLEKLPEFDKSCGEHCSYGELLLLIAIHLREKQLEQIEELISTTLDMKVSSSLRSGHFSSLTKLFLRVFSEDVVCAHAVSVSPTSNLNAKMSGYLPVHCVHQLIKMRVFRKHSISIKDWIYQQMLSISEPLHPTLPPLLQDFVHSVLLSSITVGPRTAGYTSSGAPVTVSNNHTPFSAEEVLAVFEKDPDTCEPKYAIPSQVLMLYYILLYQDCYLANLKPLLMQSGGSAPRAYGPNVITQIPVKHLLSHSQLHHANYSTVYPTLLKLTATQFPQLCLVCEWLTEKKVITVTKFDPVLKISSQKVTPDTAMEVLKNLSSSPSRALLLLNHLTTLSSSALIPYSDVLTSTLPLLLDSPAISRRVQALYLTLWAKLNAVIPRRLWLSTVNALRPAETLSMRPFTQQNLIEDPLILMRCDPRVFRCPRIFDILLRILSTYTTTSRAWLQERSYTQSCAAVVSPESSSQANQLSKQERDELCIALAAAQESAIIQLLLEVCLPTEQDKKDELEFGPQLTVLQEIRCLVCSYLHTTFIADPNLVKLVHFQGYPTELLPMMVSGVPSMHICLDFIPELLAQPQTDKQQFGIQLAAHVIQQYPLPDALGVSKDIVKRLMVLANEIPSNLRKEYFVPLFPSVVKLCQTFPPLCKDATEFLVHLNRICLSSSSPLDPPSVNKLGETKIKFESPKGITGGMNQLATSIQDTFQQLVSVAVVKL